jgi:hypothetical protein
MRSLVIYYSKLLTNFVGVLHTHTQTWQIATLYIKWFAIQGKATYLLW